MKKKALRAVITVLTLILLAAAGRVRVQAAQPVTSYNGQSYSRVYNFKYYTTHYAPAKKYANDPKGAIKHFVTTGMKKQVQASASFDPKSYRYGCADLRKKYRNNYRQYYLHFQKTGYKKSAYKKYAVGCRTMRGAATKYGIKDFKAVYDYNYYVRKYPSVIKSVGDDDKAVLKYFVTKGIRNGQTAKDPAKYPAAKSASKTYKNLKAAAKSGKLHDGTGIIVCIDPGHQRKGMRALEPLGPGSSKKKPKVTSGTYGKWSGKNEYEVNLTVSLKLRDELESRGYTVVMTRTTHNVRISNIQRAKIANSAKADIMIRIHCDGISNSSRKGVSALAAANNNPYVSKTVRKRGQKLGEYLRNGQAAATGQRRLSMIYTNTMTGINWAKMPCAIVEMGFMTNRSEDLNLSRASFQKKIVTGLANGVDNYFRSIGR